MTDKVCYWDETTGQQFVRDATPAEQAEINARKAALPSQADYVAALQTLMDDEAKTRGYDGILSACSYATSTDARFGAEGQACVAWRDAVWLTAYAVMADVQAGHRAQPTLAQLTSLAPVMVWP